MTFDHISTAACLVQRRATGCPIPDVRCSDLEWAADHPDICPGASPIVGLQVTPESGRIEVDGTLPFTAALLFANGKGKDVTEWTTWKTTDAGIATINPSGLASGVSEGVTTVRATYRNLTDFAQLQVVANCVQAGLDVVLVMDRSSAMARPDANGMTLLEVSKRAAKALSGALTFHADKDRMAVVSCAGIFTNSVPQYQPDATLHMPLSSIEDEVIAAIDHITMGQGFAGDPGGTYGSEAACGLGAGLEKARDELIAHGRANARKLIVYCGVGFEVYCQPDPEELAEDIAARNWQLAAIAVGDWVSFQKCGVGPEMATWTYLESLVMCGLFWGVSDDDLPDLPNVFAEVIYTLCGKARDNDPCVYYLPEIPAPAPSTVPYRDKLDCWDFPNWRVVSGRVDLIGVELGLSFEGHGLYIDMAGTSRYKQAIPPWQVTPEMIRGEVPDVVGNLTHGFYRLVTTAGCIETRQQFTFAPESYRLSLDIAGNNRVPRGGETLIITIGDDGELFRQEVIIANWRQPFTTYTWTFTPPYTTVGKLRIEYIGPSERHISTVPDLWNQNGLLIDNVKLENIASHQVLLYDTFD